MSLLQGPSSEKFSMIVLRKDNYEHFYPLTISFALTYEIFRLMPYNNRVLEVMEFTCKLKKINVRKGQPKVMKFS